MFPVGVHVTPRAELRVAEVEKKLNVAFKTSARRKVTSRRTKPCERSSYRNSSDQSDLRVQRRSRTSGYQTEVCCAWCALCNGATYQFLIIFVCKIPKYDDEEWNPNVRCLQKSNIIVNNVTPNAYYENIFLMPSRPLAMCVFYWSLIVSYALFIIRLLGRHSFVVFCRRWSRDCF